MLCILTALQMAAQQDVKKSSSYPSDDCDEPVTKMVVHYGYAKQNPNEWTIGPNPTYNEIRIIGEYDAIAVVQLFSITGEMLIEKEGYESYQPIDLSQLPSGIYFVRIVSLDNISKTYKVMKR
jgi:hypothetical protein